MISYFIDLKKCVQQNETIWQLILIATFATPIINLPFQPSLQPKQKILFPSRPFEPHFLKLFKLPITASKVLFLQPLKRT